MQASVEISLYPLQDGYITPIVDFIGILQKEQTIEVRVNGMSTQLFGEFQVIMKTLTTAMEATFQQYQAAVFVMKVVNACLKDVKM